jgi:phage repressor protein C with HTH and peptisase S24 domain
MVNANYNEIRAVGIIKRKRSYDKDSPSTQAVIDEVSKARGGSDDHAAFAERLRIVGKNVGSLSALARKTGVSDSTIHLWLRGSEPSREKLIALAKAGNVNVEWLISGQGPMSGPGEGYIALKMPMWLSNPDGSREGRLVNSDFAVKTEWIERLPGSQKLGALVLVRATGDAMAPLIQAGDAVLINSADKEERDGIICAIFASSVSQKAADEMEGMRPGRPGLMSVVIRQLQQRPDGTYRLICENPRFPPSDDKYQVYGRVVWFARSL